MSIPNLLHVVEVAAAEFGPLDSHERCAEFTGYVVPILHELDANIGHLRKDPSRTNYQGRAVDACLYLATGQAIDIIGGSKVASPQNPGTPAWGVEEIARYSAADWIKPGNARTPPAPVPDPSTPVPNTGTPCKAVETAAEVLDALHEIRIEVSKQNEIVLMALARLENDNRKARPVTVSGWRTGTLKGEVSGV
jgi:hypothetical protein